MNQWKINGVSLDFDAEDAEIMENFELAVSVLDEEKDKITDDKNLSYPAILKALCMAYRDFFDNVFGSGTAEKIFAGQKFKPSLHEEAFLSLLDFIKAQKAVIADERKKRWQKYQVRKTS